MSVNGRRASWLIVTIASLLPGGCKPNPLRDFEPRRGEVRFNLDRLNDQLFTGDRPVVLDSLIDQDWALCGWAIDSVAKRPAGGVWLALDGRIADAKYGTSRPDVVAATHEPAYAQTGFELHLKNRDLGKGPHTIEVVIRSADGAGYYRPPQQWGLEVR
jgi:hypothetical protein